MTKKTIDNQLTLKGLTLKLMWMINYYANVQNLVMNGQNLCDEIQTIVNKLCLNVTVLQDNGMNTIHTAMAYETKKTWN